MHVFARVLQAAPAVAAALLFAGCGGNAASPVVGIPGYELAAGPLRSALAEPALIAFEPNGSLGYWPIRHRGGSTLTPLSGTLGVEISLGMAAEGNVVVVASYRPAKIVTYNAKTKAVSTLGDPYGQPDDVAVGKNGTIYALNAANVVVYAPKSKKPLELTCAEMGLALAIAVDNEGDVFVDGYEPGSGPGIVIEYANGSANCTVPHLRPSEGYVGGVGIDPKTDDLIVIDDPDYCAGGLEGRMIIYHKPYSRRHSVRHNLEATYCAGTFRLDAGAKHIFYADWTVSRGFPLVDQAQYPSGTYDGQYHNGYNSASGSFTGFATIPNTLPN